jgi:putative ABC transport system permease protein
MSKLAMKNLATGKEHPIRLVAFEPDDPVWAPSELTTLAPALTSRDTIIVDRKSRKDYGRLQLGPAQLARHDVQIVGQFALGTDFTTDGTAMSSIQTFVDVTHIPDTTIEFLLIKAKPGVSPESLVEPLRQAMPKDVSVSTRAEMREHDLIYWNKSSPVGIVMGMGMFLGFLAGIGIVYQILFAQIADYLKEFATLRAIGWSGPSIVSIVLFQAVLLAVLGFIPSLGIGYGIYKLVEVASGLPMRVTVDRAGSVLAMTAVMCLFAGVLAVRRLLEADPAELFA